MNWVTVIWSMVASACLTLAVVYLMVWFQKRSQWGYLLFSLAAVGTAGLTFFEVWALRAESVEEFGRILRWGHVPFWVLLLALVAFVRVYMRAGRLWLAWTICSLRTLSLILNFVFTPNINYREISSLQHVRLLGESVSVVVGIPNPWMLIGQASLVLFLVFLLDATVTIWRRGERRSMLLLSCTMSFFMAVTLGKFLLTFWGISPMALTSSFYFLGVVLVMAWEMSRETIRASQLSDDLSEKNNWLDLAIEAAGAGLWSINKDTGQIWATDSALMLYGLKPGESATIEKFLSIVHQDDRERLARLIDDTFLNHRSFKEEYRITLPDGSIRWMAVRGGYWHFPGKSAVMTGVSIDITDRIEILQRQQTEQAFTNTLLECLPGIFYLYTYPEMRLVRWNRNHETATGYGPEELYNRYALDWYAPADQEAVAAGIRKVIEFGSFMIESSLIMKDGRSVPYLLTGTRFQFSDQLYCMGVGLDISELKQIRADLQQKRNELAHVTRVSMLGQLASTIAHELNQPLGAILRNAEAAELFLQEPAPDLDELRAILADIRKDDRRAGAVIDRMRGLMEQRTIELCPLDLNLLTGEVIAMVQSDADKRHIQLTQEINPQLPPVLGDRVQLQQVLINLLLNAFDALDGILPQKGLVTVRTRSVESKVEVAVRDNGHGIAEDKLRQVFEPYFTSKSGGLGMGLAISHDIVESHGGRLWAENNQAGGATFTISLPTATGGAPS